VVPRYFFHVYDGDVVILRDTQGFEFPSESALRENCAVVVQAVVEEEALDPSITNDRIIRVVDENDRVVIEVPIDS
jgi:hypothetical protein